MKYYYMANFEFNPNWIGSGAGAALGLGAGLLSAGQLKDYKDGNAGDWRNELLVRGAIGTGIGALGGGIANRFLGKAKLDYNIEQVRKYKQPSNNVIQTPGYNPHTKPLEPIPDLKTAADVDAYMQGKPGYMSSEQYKQKLNDPNHVWEF